MAEPSVIKEERFTVADFSFLRNQPNVLVAHLKIGERRGNRIKIRINESHLGDGELIIDKGVNESSWLPLHGQLDLGTRSGWVSYD